MPWPSENDHDTEVFDLLEKERIRQNSGLQLIASENFTSPDVMRATGSSASSIPSARCTNWPAPTRTGVRGSIVIPKTLGGGRAPPTTLNPCRESQSEQTTPGTT